MADTVLFGLAKSVLGALGSPAVQEFKLLWGVEQQLKGLRDTVTTIQAALIDAERRRASDASIQTLLERLKTVLYEADDLFDEITFNDLHEKARNGSKIEKKVRRVLSKPRYFAFTVKAAHRVRAIREHLNAIAKDIQGYNFLIIQTEQDPPRRFHFDREETQSYVSSSEVVGRDRERDELVDMLISGCSKENEKGISVIAVIGIGGLGKTTLSQLVYNDERVQRSFDLCVWSCANYFSSLEQILPTLLETVTRSKVEVKTAEIMKSKFIEEIKGKKFLLVLDDVWDEDSQNWRKLKALLDCGKSGSMVLSTTRSVKVAQSLSAIEPYYHLQHISNESAQLLFKKIAFCGKHLQHSSRLEDLGQQIVKKCANVPLVIVIIASFLKHQEEKKWYSLANHELPVVVPGDYTKVMEVLRFSYTEFPRSVKCCFAFCSLFPKDHIFKKDRLIRLWVAEGFFEYRDKSQSLEDQAEDCFFYLVDRCFFQNIEAHVEKYTTTYTFQMHDVVHDLAKVVVGSESILVDKDDAEKPWNSTLRHVSLVNHLCFSHQSKRLRTFIHFKGEYVGISTLNKLISNFKGLRALDLSKLKIETIPSSIGTLIHLRFLDLSRNVMEGLPSSICSLHHLQSLILKGCSLLKNLPVGIGSLLNLRHLILDGCENLSLIPQGLAALTSLITLDKLVTYKPAVELAYLEYLNNLSGALEIVIQGKFLEIMRVDAHKSYLSEKSELKALTVEFPEEETGGNVDMLMDALAPHPNLEYLELQQSGICRLPNWVKSHDRLVILKLESCNQLVELPPLSHLPSLKKLFIRNMLSMVTIEGSCMLDEARSIFYPSLETLHIRNIPNLKGWWGIEPAVKPRFPRVTNVKIRECLKLRDTYMPFFPKVESLRLKIVQDGVMWHCIGSDLATSALKSISLFKIIGLRSIGEAQIRHLSNLQNLHISYCTELEKVSLRSLTYLTSLVKLIISMCDVLRWEVGGYEEVEMPEVVWGNLTRLEVFEIPNVNRSCFKFLKYFISLQQLSIYNFDKDLQSALPSDNIVEEEQELEGGMPWKSLQNLREMKLRFGFEFSNRDNQQLLRGMECLANSLKCLTLSFCNELYLSWGMLLSLDHLEELHIIGVQWLTNVDDPVKVQQLSNTTSPLRKLRIYGGSQEWIFDIPWKSFSSLHTLELWDIINLKAIPEGIQHLASLQQLDIAGCERVVSLPTWITSLSSLLSLNIGKCSEELHKRCKEQTGGDWPLIQNIQLEDTYPIELFVISIKHIYYGI